MTRCRSSFWEGTRLLLLCLFLIVMPVAAIELPQQNGLNLTVVDKQQASLYDAEHPGTYFFNIGNNMSNGGQNAIRISDSYLTPYGTITVSDSSTGTFYITDTGGKGYEDEAILLIAVQESGSSADFSIDLTVEGYKFLDHAADGAPTIDQVGTFNSEAYVATLRASDFLTYNGALVSQAWKPSTISTGDVNMKFFDGQDLAGPKYNLILVDLNTSIVGRNAPYQNTLTNYGNPKVTYTIHGYSGGNVSFAPYAWVAYQTGGGGYFDRTIGWTSRSSDSSWLVTLAEAGDAPVADFTATPTSGTAPLTVQFTDASTGSPTSWAWDFENDGTVDSTEQNPSFTYTAAGIYTVTLTSTNAGGSDSEEKIEYITVTAAPVADFTVSPNTPTTGVVPLFVRFTDTSANTPTEWLWDFGDGGTSTEQNVTHTYMAAGTYTVTLTATNAGGSDSEVKSGLVTVTVGTGGLADSAWPKFGGNLNNTGQSPFVGSQTNTVKWTYTLGKVNYPSPVIGSDGTIYIGSTGGNALYALDQNGTLKWKYAVTGMMTGVTASAAIGSDGTIYVPGTASGNYLTALNPNGTPKWSIKNINGGAHLTIGSDGTIYSALTSIFSAVYPNGTTKWTTSLGGSSTSPRSPAITPDGTIYTVTTTPNMLHALNPDGTIKWQYSSAGGLDTPVVLGSDGTIYIASSDKNVTALNPNGTMKWQYNNGVDAYSYGSLALAPDGTIYVGSVNNNFTALNPDGTLKWFYPTGGEIRGSPTIGSDGTIYFGNAGDMKMYSLNANGTLKWTYTTGSAIWGTPAIGPDGTLYIGSRDGKLYAFAGVVDFTADKTTGIGSPFTVQFTGTSPLSVTGWHWDFGDGTTSTEQNPSHTYTSLGAYAVNLTITHASGTNYLNRPGFITVASPVLPVANFTANVNAGPFPLAVEFTDTSTDTPTSWAWDFNNDGTTDATTQNASYTYTTAGTYTVNFTVANAAGNDSEVKTDCITVTTPVIPVASFTATSRAGIAPLTVPFTDTSLYSPTLWSWDFGDGTTSAEQNPVHTFAAVGTYNVSLTATNADGSDTVIKTGYIVVTGTGPVPLPAGQSFNLYVANDEGVKYNVENGVTNPARYTPYVFIDNTYHFLYDGQGGGTNALHVSNDPSVTAGQVTTTTNQSGTFWFTFTGGQPNLHDAVLLLAVNGTIPDDFAVRIRSSGYDFEPPIPDIINNNTIGTPTYVDGAINQTFTKEDFIYGPQIWRPHRVSDYPVFVGQDMSDAENTFQLMFIDLRLGCTQSKTDGYVRVEYDFNNLNSFAVFNGYGWYSASNHGTGIIMTTSGTEYQVIGDSGSSGPVAPVADFISDVQTGIAPLTVQFTDTSTNTPTSWSWDFGDGATSIDQNPSHQYTAAGIYNVSLTATNAGGSDTETKAGFITVTAAPTPPVAAFVAIPSSGTAPLTVQLSDQSIGTPTSWLWDFGDGANSTDQNPSHTYTSVGMYTVTLTATNAHGSDVEEKTGYIHAVDSSQPTVILAPQTGNVPVGGTTEYTLTINSLPAGIAGYNLSVSLSNPAAAEITAFSLPNWAALNVSSSTPADSVWFSGLDLARSVEAGATNVPLGTVTVRGDALGRSQVVVTVAEMDADGGALIIPSIVNGQLNVYQPVVADFSADNTIGKLPFTVHFTDLSTGDPVPTSWSWDFGDGTTSTDKNPTHTYTSGGQFTVTLTASSTYSHHTVTKANYITVTRHVVTFPGCENPPLDPDHDGRYEDINGNGRLDFHDVVTLYQNMQWVRDNTEVGVEPFDFNGNGRLDYDDVVLLYYEVLEG